MNSPALLLAVAACMAYFPCIDGDRLLFLFLDGFRYDYLNRSELPLPGFERMAQLGSKANGLIPVFPSLTFPNFYSLVTGLYSESHGLTGNHMYDVTRNESFQLGVNPESQHPHWWNNGEPLWVTAVKQNKRIDMYYSLICNVTIRGIRPTYCLQYKSSPSIADLRGAINLSLQNFTRGLSDGAAIYFDGVDLAGHAQGPSSDPVQLAIQDLDHVVSDLVLRLSEPCLRDVNLVIASDHGMTQTGPERLINISAVLQPSQYIVMLDAYAIVSIYTLPGQTNQVYRKLRNFHPNMTVYLKSDLPARWNYKRGRNVAPVIVVADSGWMIITPSAKTLYRGYHGYDPSISRDMQGIFLAMGPAFRPGASVETLRNVDLYNVMCQILNVEPSPNNGTLANIAPLLRRHFRH